MLKNYRGRFPFKLATTSYIYPDEILPNVVKLAPFFDEIELVLFESTGPDSIPDPLKIDHLIELSKLHQLGFNIHLPLDLSLGDERDDVRTHGTWITKTVIERTLSLNPSLYTLHLDFINPPNPPLRKRLCRNEQEAVVRTTRDRRSGDEASERKPSISQLPAFKPPNRLNLAEGRWPVRVNEPHSKAEEPDCLCRVRPAFTMNTTQSLKGEERGSAQERDIKAWQGRVARSLIEILNNGIEAKRISIETLAYPFEWIEDIVKEFGFSICLDIGHILTHGYDLGHYLRTYLARTSIIHFHGVREGSDHFGIETLPKRDLNLILSSLRHFDGIVSIEVFSIKDLTRSLDVLEDKWIKS